MFNSKRPFAVGEPAVDEGTGGVPTPVPPTAPSASSYTNPVSKAANHPPHSNMWKRYGDLMMDGINYLEQRKNGRAKSLKTQWSGFNKIGLNGIEWQSLYVVGARPGVGKTLFASSITRDLQRLNPDQDFSVLHFQFEMLGRNMAIRELSTVSSLNVRYIQSAQDDGLPPLSEDDYKKLANYANKQVDRQEYVVDTATSVAQFQEIVEKFYAATKKPFVVTLDHTLLIKRGASETNQQQTLEKLATVMTMLKNKYPVIFIVLTQLNRDIDNAERQIPGKLSNYPTEADVFGSDSLLQCADVMIAMNRPAKYSINLYGPHQYIIEPSMENYLALHVLKNRFGDVSVQWYYANYSIMNLQEVAAPRKKPKKTT
jgi:replicative DNA helicase